MSRCPAARQSLRSFLRRHGIHTFEERFLTGGDVQKSLLCRLRALHGCPKHGLESDHVQVAAQTRPEAVQPLLAAFAANTHPPKLFTKSATGARRLQLLLQQLLHAREPAHKGGVGCVRRLHELHAGLCLAGQGGCDLLHLGLDILETRIKLCQKLRSLRPLLVVLADLHVWAELLLDLNHLLLEHGVLAEGYFPSPRCKLLGLDDLLAQQGLCLFQGYLSFLQGSFCLIQGCFRNLATLLSNLTT
mmetsp:Transcript_31648/g.56829  ORF Transcript_31648/g.56829 Transcript_31648/m.56829 type:complete len:246 (-) Transcript_31648:881-1618(-)